MTTRRHLRIYIAGPIQGQTLIHSLANIHNGKMWTARLFQLGFSPFPVFTDHGFIEMVRPVPHIQEIYNYSLAWLRAADAMYCIDGWEHSKGCAAEIKEAERCAVPVFFDISDLCAWADRKIIPPIGSNIDEQLARSDD